MMRRHKGHKSHSSKDQRTSGREYWSRRPGYMMPTPCREAKQRTHRLECQQAKQLCELEIEP